MEKIKLEKLEVKDNRVEFFFSVSEKIKPYLKANSFVIEYSENISDVPISVLSVAFVGNFLPFAWFFDAEISMDELDEDFHGCLPKIRAGYEYMYPKWKMGGKVSVKRIVVGRRLGESRAAAFFSGGLDAVETLLRHCDEKPDLLTIWGADIKYDNNTGWGVVHRNVKEVANLMVLDNIVIKSNFRFIENEGALHDLVYPVLGDGWWHGIKHALAMAGSAAPIAHVKHYDKIYIASSYCATMGVVKCASNPWTDNEIRFCGCSVVHDSFEHSRQDKAATVVAECNRRSIRVPLHVCWQTQTGNNCCACEKCFRTIFEILVEGADPAEFGFLGYREHFTRKNVVNLLRRTFYCENAKGYKAINVIWDQSKKRIKEREAKLKESEYWTIFKWILEHDLTSNKSITLPFADRIAPYTARARRLASRVYHKVFG